MRRWSRVGLGVLGGVVAIQLVPVPRTNPPVTAEIHAPPEVMAVLRRACFDCHSNQTVWPWYGHVAPVSWLLYRDVMSGRRHLNFSEWGALAADKRQKKQLRSGKEVDSGEMPLWFYLPMHPGARLSERDRQVIDAWSNGAVSE